ncbi:MAG: bifunctional phosphopantothenoylcysteine decarboxylase/phosphopantothenate--cysteine ligase CoaBC [Acidobacteria bacterium]|nr:bifunctional phosphopantothenoylcysteine decarboxylase/phosphopantothenate--cysteine ligase CoaBC [Acidobacteriota bacterium]|tara:strand:- start:154 stop:1404 length:1251 start_codon:yes stop_codon:yes gene_type:complete
MGLVALGVCGGIGAYKAVEIARGLQESGHEVVAIMTRNAHRFVGSLTFEAITQRAVISDQFFPGVNSDIKHISLASDIDALLVAPATANTIGKLAHGIADDFLTTLYLATRAPVVLAPAMNTNMLEHQAVVANLATLEAHGAQLVPPAEGYLACGWTGQGRLAEPSEVVAAIVSLIGGQKSRDLVDRCLVVAAGPTYEDIDPVRFIGNRSSGRMGLELAAEIADRGGRVTLVLGPCSLVPPPGVEVFPVRNAEEMRATVLQQARGADAVIMAAAVADYTLAGGPHPLKLAKNDGTVTLKLRKTVDILSELGRLREAGKRPVLVGFAAETHNLVVSAKAKLQSKAVDLIVANDISREDAGFEVDTNAAVLIEESSETEVPLMSKRQLAAVILDRIAGLLSKPPLVTEVARPANDGPS